MRHAGIVSASGGRLFLSSPSLVAEGSSSTHAGLPQRLCEWRNQGTAERSGRGNATQGNPLAMPDISVRR
jgi:hypothetical protein